MSSLFTPEELILATHGYWRNGIEPHSAVECSTDSRVDNHGCIFIALSGEKFDAHDFLDSAVASGAACLCVAAEKLAKVPENIPSLVVTDTLKAYQALGHYHRMRFPNLKVAGVTGSVGKTSVKEMLRAIATAAVGAENVLYTLGNTNNQVGAVQNLLRLSPQHQWAILEMGTSSHGEIEPLTKMISPQVALINTIAPCHLEHLGNLHGVAQEKCMIFVGLPVTGTAIIPIEAPESQFIASQASNFHHITFGTTPQADVYSQWESGSLSGGNFTLYIHQKGYKISWQLSGAHQAANASAAAAAALALGVDPEVIVQGLQNTQLPGMRMKTTIINGVKYINDAYNANPASMRAALAQFEDSPRLHLVLGGMRELGAQSGKDHQELYELVASKFPQASKFYIGAEFAAAGIEAFPDAPSLQAILAAKVKSGDIVFAKGSRGNAVELALPPNAR